MTTFRFCRDCNNMLYPREDKDNSRLLFECRTCSYVEEAGAPLVYRHELITNIGETAGVVQDIGSDPTLPRSDRECPHCHSHENVFFQSQQRRKDTSMVLFFVCLACSHIFTSDQKNKRTQFS
ncbi:DNA-directed RNA polymerase II subunit Rpb9p [Monosporozyma servazzii]